MLLCLEPLKLFDEMNPDDNRRPDILLRNPHGGGKQVIIDVAVTDIDDCNRKIDDNPLQPLKARFQQKNSKYKGVADENGFEFMPFVFSHNGQIHPETVSFICRQLEAKLMLVDGRVSKSNKESIWKL